MTSAACGSCRFWGGLSEDLEAPCRALESVGLTLGALYRPHSRLAVAQPESRGEIVPGVRYVLKTARTFGCVAFEGPADDGEEKKR